MIEFVKVGGMKIHGANLALALCIGVGMIAVSAAPAAAQQDRGNQSQEQKGGHKATTHENKGHQRPQQAHAQHPQASHAEHKPAATNHARPATNHARPATNHARPATNHARPATNHARPATNHARPATNHARPATNHTRPQPGRPATRPAHGHANYQFRSNDQSRLRQYYQGGFGKINRGRRPHFYRGGYIGLPYRTYIQPVPYSLIGYLPPVPPGYALGYYDGYVVVYDPATYVILSVLNLLQ